MHEFFHFMREPTQVSFPFPSLSNDRSMNSPWRLPSGIQVSVSERYDDLHRPCPQVGGSSAEGDECRPAYRASPDRRGQERTPGSFPSREAAGGRPPSEGHPRQTLSGSDIAQYFHRLLPAD